MKLKRNEYLQLVGLLAVAQTHVRMVNDIEKAICKIVGEKPDGMGHSCDAIWSNYSADTLLEKVAARNKVMRKK